MSLESDEVALRQWAVGEALSFYRPGGANADDVIALARKLEDYVKEVPQPPPIAEAA